MHVADLMTRDASICAPEDTLEEPARIMWENDCGCVPVVDPRGRVVGMITDRDICMAAYTRGISLSAARVDTAMSREPKCIREDQSALEAELMMQEHRVRRLPVVDAEGTLVGMLSLADLATAMRSRHASGIDGFTWFAVANTLAAVSTPRTCRVREEDTAPGARFSWRAADREKIARPQASSARANPV